MPFSLTNAPTTFQAYIHQALAGLLNTIYIIYLNDILIFSKTREQYADHIQIVLHYLHEYRLYLNHKKWEFFAS